MWTRCCVPDVEIELAGIWLIKQLMMNETVCSQTFPGSVALTTQPEVEGDLQTHLDQANETEEESLWRIIIHNDDVTPMEFVVVILQRIFELLPLEAKGIKKTFC